MSDIESRVYVIEHTLGDHNSRMINQRTDHEKLEQKYNEIETKLAGVKGDVRAYTVQHGESIKTLQDAVQALKELTAELKQESKIQEKSIEAVIEQMKTMNTSIVDMSKTIHKFLYIGSGIIITLTLISNGTIGKFINTVAGG
jgi:ATP-dependent Clp protease ATP-binding subunit ClpA